MTLFVAKQSLIPLPTMDLLNPSFPPGSPFSPESLSGSPSPAISRRGFDRSTTPLLPEIVEEDGNSAVHVAVGNSVEKTTSLLGWTLDRFPGKDICLLHVYKPSLHIPTPLGKLPASQANPEVLSAHRKHEKERALTLLRSYLTACYAAKVNVSTVAIEADQVEKGIVDLVKKNGITRLVMGAPPQNCMKVKKRLSKANYAAKHVPLFCEIFFISKGKHLWTRNACGGPSISPRSFRISGNKSVHPFYSETSDDAQGDPGRVEVASSSTLSVATSAYIQDLFASISTRSPSLASGSASTGRSASEDSDSNVDGGIVYGPFVDAKMEARPVVNKISKFEYSLECEVKLRKEAERALRTTQEDRDKILKAREDMTQELHWTRKNVALLNSWAQQSNRRHEEASRELELVQETIASLTRENQRIRRQNTEATYWLDRWRNRGQGRSANCNSLVGSVEELPGIAEFSLLDLQSATCNFSESFKIGQGGYGCIYKGEMLGRTVAIRKLHPYNTQGESEFQQEVKVLGKLQHPHLLSLLGVCPEAWSIVYEYLPNGSLQDNLFRKNRVLPWKIRVRIIANIASALCFLHSSKPEKIVHGNLTPRKILMDSTLSCKISDFGISTPSMRWSAEPNAAFPYTDPEFPRLGILTPKSDAYSFGLIILQLLTRRPPMGLVGEVRKAVLSGEFGAVVDYSAGEWPEFVVRRLAEVALQCCELNSRERPELTTSLVRELEQLQVSEEMPVPSFFLCPILQEIMHDPQVAADGFTYEGGAMRGWLESGKDTSPMTNLRLPHLRLTPNHAIRLAIHDWLCCNA